MMKAPDGEEFFGADEAGIELRVTFWVAGHTAGLNAIHMGHDLYCEQATDIYKKKITKGAHPTERQVGKKVVLGAGFGLGWARFKASCAEDGIEVSAALAKAAIASYRRKHWPVPKLWSNLERAAIAAVQKPGKVFKINRTKWFVEGDYLWCELPSGRRLAYYGPTIKHKATPWGEMRPTLYHWGVHPKTKKWVLDHTYGGKLTENVVQAISRDILVHNMPAIEAAGYAIRLHAHDEVLASKAKGTGSVAEIETLLAKNPPWAPDLPIKAEGWTGPRYRK